MLQLLSESSGCVNHKCGAPFQEEDVIVLNGNKEDVEILKKRMEERRLKSKLEKKSKKGKTAATASQQEPSADSPGPSKAKNGKDSANSSSGENRQIIFTKSSENGNPAVPGKATKASSSTKRSIADSEDKSEAYKSIFTTHSSAKRSKEECSNWVTHTAYYF
ncbi:protein RTF2 [Turdus rufiventris]|nr:protein RTF2 [Turdus rufiventris]